MELFHVELMKPTPLPTLSAGCAGVIAAVASSSYMTPRSCVTMCTGLTMSATVSSVGMPYSACVAGVATSACARSIRTERSDIHPAAFSASLRISPVLPFVCSTTALPSASMPT